MKNNTINRIKDAIAQWINYYFFYPKVSRSFQFQVLSNDETLNRVIAEKTSVSRFGDGELVLMNMQSIGFQDADFRLKERLEEIIDCVDEGIMICLTDIMLNTKGLRKETAKYCRSYTVNHKKMIEDKVPRDRVFGCTNFTRFYADWAVKDQAIMQDKVEKLKKIWGGVRCLDY